MGRAGTWCRKMGRTKGYSLFAPASHPPGASTSPRPFGSEQLRLLRSSYPVARQNALEVSKPELLPEHFAPPPSVRDRASGGGKIRTSRGRRARRTQKPLNSADFERERDRIRIAVQSQNNPQEPNLTRKSGNGSRCQTG